LISELFFQYCRHPLKIKDKTKTWTTTLKPQ
jgi:hypothetical protein